MTKNPPGAMSTPFPVKVTEEKLVTDEVSQRKTSMKLRRPQQTD